MSKVSVFLCAALLLVSNSVSAAPKAKLIEFWHVTNEQSDEVVDHFVWQSLLDAYLDDNHVSGINRFDYDAVSDLDRARLSAYLDDLQGRDPRALRPAEQFAYWVNLYNALTVQTVLQAMDNKPITSIKDIRFSWFSFGPWSKKLIKVQGQELSLDDIEHGILRPIWKDRRIHFAVNCASLGCPNLQAQAFTSSNAEQLLMMAEREFINHPRGVRVLPQTLQLSSLFKWYRSDFAGDEAGLLEYLASYLDQDLDVDGLSDKDIKYDYDWRLNRQRN